MRRWLTTGIILGLCLLGPRLDPAAADAVFFGYTNLESDFRIDLPRAWKTKADESMVTSICKGSPTWPALKVAVTYRPSMTPVSLRDVSNQLVDVARSSIDGARILEFGKITVNDNDANWFIVSGKNRSTDGPLKPGEPITSLVLVTKGEKKYFVVACTTTAPQFPQIRPLFERIATSLTFAREQGLKLDAPN